MRTSSRVWAVPRSKHLSNHLILLRRRQSSRSSPKKGHTAGSVPRGADTTGHMTVAREIPHHTRWARELPEHFQQLATAPFGSQPRRRVNLHDPIVFHGVTD